MEHHNGLLTVDDLRAVGVTVRQVDRRLATGRLQPLQRGAWTAGGRRVAPETRLAAACWAAGPRAAASHRSAGWYWGLIEWPPKQPELTVPTDVRRRNPGAVIHRSAELGRGWTTVRGGLLVTTPVRTLVDLAAVLSPAALDAPVDIALARRLVERRRLVDAAMRLRRPGRPGPPALLSAVERRGMLDPPAPSVLESIVRRCLHGWGIEPLAVEHRVMHDRYRLDFVLCPRLALEVDGFAYHSSPEAKAADAIRRNELRLEGWTVIEADWITVTRTPSVLRRQLERAIALAHDPRSALGP